LRLNTHNNWTGNRFWRTFDTLVTLKRDIFQCPTVFWRIFKGLCHICVDKKRSISWIHNIITM
jgi:recombinational DNA repair protein RecR